MWYVEYSYGGNIYGALIYELTEYNIKKFSKIVEIPTEFRQIRKEQIFDFFQKGIKPKIHYDNTPR